MAENIPSDGWVIRNARLAVKFELEKKRILNQPIARFDPRSGEVYMENADGTRTVTGHVTYKGRCGEQHGFVAAIDHKTKFLEESEKSDAVEQLMRRGERNIPGFAERAVKRENHK